ncbi:MAG TPA: cytochrome o ubiquinol oxidase subunit IV [Bordetella sp.]
MASISGHAAGRGRRYATGFILSLLLTVLSFGAATLRGFSHDSMLGLVVVLAVVQLLVQLVYFLHLGSAKDARENTVVFTCTAMLILIIVAGSLWVMHNANLNMMPTSMSVESARTRN